MRICVFGTKVRWISRSSRYPLAGENRHPVGAGFKPVPTSQDFQQSVTRDDAKVVIPNIVRASRLTRFIYLDSVA
jgi:hypothetical protein